MGKLTPHTFKKKLNYKDAVDMGYFGHWLGGNGIVIKVMMWVRIPKQFPHSCVRLLLLKRKLKRCRK